MYIALHVHVTFGRYTYKVPVHICHHGVHVCKHVIEHAAEHIGCQEQLADHYDDSCQLVPHPQGQGALDGIPYMEMAPQIHQTLKTFSDDGP